MPQLMDKEKEEEAKMALANFIARNYDKVMDMPLAEFPKFMKSFISSHKETKAKLSKKGQNYEN